MNELSIRVPAHTSRVILSKAIVILLSGVAFGYAIIKDSARDFARGTALTKEAYLADFEHYRAALLAKEPNVALYLVVAVGMVGMLFGLYEALSRLVAWALTKPPFQLWPEDRPPMPEPPAA
jgi:hypothetical protein